MKSISLLCMLWDGVGGDPQPLDANLQAVISPFVRARKIAGGKGAFVDFESVVQKYM